MTQPQLLNQMEGLLKELAILNTPKFKEDGPVGTLLDIITKKDLLPNQRLIMLYLVFTASREPIHQPEICKALGLSNKCVRENLTILHYAGYVKRGPGAYTWEVN